ncbi:hypothetical protein IAD21_01147 [Abditibacteriota bacterium]|nr:hypothetical protein IAD21_01147 [Abditibacteriota bacterium]
MTNHYSLTTWTRCALLLGTTVFSVGVAHADLGFWSRALIGTWRHPTNGDLYRFNSNATYTFTAGKASARTGQLAHSGSWKIAQPTQRESGGSMEGPVALVLNSHNRTIKRNGRKVTLTSTRSFRLVVDVVHKGGEDIEPNHYYIGRTKWIRVR